MTFLLQNKLPRLPVPCLQETLTLYQESLRPLLTKEEFEQSKKNVALFRVEGQKLQQKLLDHDKTQPNNWLEQWWHMSYMGWRVPLLVNSNWWLLLRNDHLRQTILRNEKYGEFTRVQMCRAASVTSGLLDYKRRLELGLIPPQHCMDQFRHVFGVTRIAKPKFDELKKQFPCNSKHIAVLCKGSVFKVNVEDYSPERLRRVFTYICLNAKKGSYVNMLTAQHRDIWAEQRLQINSSSLECVEDSLFVLSLCEEQDKNFQETTDFDEELGQKYLRIVANEPKYLWMDKSLSVLVFPSGYVGCNGEHSPQDAMTPMSIFVDVVSNEQTLFSKANQDFCSPLQEAKLLPFEHNFTPKLESKLEYKLLIFQKFGSKSLKDLKVSPDAFIQIAMQHAYFQMYKTCCSTYETASLRKFKHGRTEAVRVCSMDTLNFCLNPNYESFKKAHDSHLEYMNRASNGQGIDRHLMALELLGSNSFFNKHYFDSKSWVLSTSSLGSKAYLALYGTGFGRVNKIGVNYYVAPDHLRFGIEGNLKLEKSLEFCHNLIKSKL